MWLGLKLFATAFPADMQMKVLRGEAKLRLAMRDAPPPVRDLMRELHVASNRRVTRADGTPLPRPEAEWVEFSSEGINPPEDSWPLDRVQWCGVFCVCWWNACPGCRDGDYSPIVDARWRRPRFSR